MSGVVSGPERDAHDERLAKYRWTLDRDNVRRVSECIADYPEILTAVEALGWRPPTEPTDERCGATHQGIDNGAPCRYLAGHLAADIPHTTANGFWWNEPTAERAGDADDVAAVLAPFLGHCDRDPEGPIVKGFAAQLVRSLIDDHQRALAAQPAAVTDPAETLQVVIASKVKGARQEAQRRRQKSGPNVGSDVLWWAADEFEAVLGDPSGALAERDAKVRADLIHRFREYADNTHDKPTWETVVWNLDRLAADTGSTP